MKKLILIQLSMFLLVFAQICCADSVTFQGLGPPPGTDIHCRALNISSDGKTVVGYSSIYSYPKDSFDRKAFRWTEETGMICIAPSYSYAEAVSSDGYCIVGSRGGGTTGFIWTDSEGVQNFEDLPDGSVFSLANGISDDGLYVVGVNYNDYGGGACRWNREIGMVNLMSGGVANGISADGSVVVGSNGSAFMWTECGGIRDLGHMMTDDVSPYTTATAVSADGSIIVGYTHARYLDKRGSFRWTEETGIVDLGCIPGEEYYSGPMDVSADGSIIVGYAQFNTKDSAMIWSESLGMRSLLDLLENDYGLDLSGWHLQNATAISNDGLTIVGYGTNPLGLNEAWIVTIPEPTTLLLFSLGMIFLRTPKK